MVSDLIKTNRSRYKISTRHRAFSISRICLINRVKGLRESRLYKMTYLLYWARQVGYTKNKKTHKTLSKSSLDVQRCLVMGLNKSIKRPSQHSQTKLIDVRPLQDFFHHRYPIVLHFKSPTKNLCPTLSTSQVQLEPSKILSNRKISIKSKSR
jgi:hypothetical protein